MPDQERLRRLIDRRKSFASRLFVRLAEHYRARTETEIQSRGFPDFSNTYIQVLFNLEIDGNRITTLAERARVTVQAVGKLVRDLEEKDYVRRSPDPTDGRAQIVTLTEKGLRFFEVGTEVIAENEAEMASIIGADSLERVAHDLRKIAEEIDPVGF